jgi:hypothetical protein
MAIGSQRPSRKLLGPIKQSIRFRHSRAMYQDQKEKKVRTT